MSEGSRHLPGDGGIAVRICDNDSPVCFPAAAIHASSVLQMLATDELSADTQCHQSDTDTAGFPVITIPAMFGGSIQDAKRSLQHIATAFSAGGLPFALRWEPGDVDGLRVAAATFNCIHFLDVPYLADYACCEFAAAIVHRSSSPVEATMLFCGRSEPNLDVGNQICVGQLLASAPMLGSRGKCFLCAWSCESSPLVALPSAHIRDILALADKWTCHEPGVKDILASSCLKTEQGDIAADRAAKAACVSAEGMRQDAMLCHAIDIVMARGLRYHGSSLLLDALAAQAVCEQCLPDLRVRAVRALAQLAEQGDQRVTTPLLQILAASKDSGGELFEDHGSGKHESGSNLESPVAAAARRMGLDGAWQVRVAACMATAVVAIPGERKAVIALVAAIDHGYFEVRIAAARAIAVVGCPGDQEATKALVHALSDDDWRVREASTASLVDLTARTHLGNSGGVVAQAAVELVPVICERLADRNSDARQAVQGVLRLLGVHCGVVEVASAVVWALSRPVPGRRVPLLRRPAAEVREAAVAALGDAFLVLATQEMTAIKDATLAAQSEAIDALGRALTDRSPVVRRASVSALIGRGSSGSSNLSGLGIAADDLGGRNCTSLMHEQLRLRLTALAVHTASLSGPALEQALEVVQAIAPLGHEGALAVALGALSDATQPACVRRMALTALGRVMVPGNKLSVEAVVNALRDPEVEVQNEASLILHRTAEGRQIDLQALLKVAEDSSATVAAHRRALHCLARIAPHGDARILACATSVLDSSDAGLRGEALSLVVRVAEPGDEAARALVAARLGDTDAGIRRLAMDACHTMAEEGDVSVLEALVCHSVTGEYCLRQIAVKTLQRISGSGNQVVLQALLPWLEYGHWPQRHAALEAIVALAKQGDDQVLAAILQRVSDCDAVCRQAACEALSHVATVGDENVISVLFNRLEDPSWLVREAAGDALAKLASQNTVLLLERLLARTDDDIGRTVRGVLAALQAPPAVDNAAAHEDVPGSTARIAAC